MASVSFHITRAPILASVLTLVLLMTELNQLTGIAALLTYPLDIEDVQAEEAELAQARTTTTTGEAGADDEAI